MKYRIRISIVRRSEVRTFVFECLANHMSEALEKAHKWAFFALEDEKGDYIGRIDVEALEVWR